MAKWLFIVSSLRQLDGGPPRGILRLTTSLAAQGETVHVLGMSDIAIAHPDAAGAVAAGVRVRVVKNRRMGRFRLSLAYLRAALTESRDTQIVSCHGFYQWPAIVSYIVARRRNATLLLQPHGVFEPYQEIHSSKFKSMFMLVTGRRIINFVSYIMVAADSERVGVAKTLGETARKKTVVVGVGTDIGPQSPDQEERAGIIFLSRIARKKRLDLLLEALALLPDRHARIQVTICGTGDTNLIQDLKKIDSGEAEVSWVGHVEGAAKNELLKRHALMCLPSENENFGQVVTEAMAAGTPVLTTPHVGAASHVEACGGGWVTELSTPQAIAAALTAALDDERTLRVKGRSALQYARKNLDWDSVAHSWVRALNGGRP